MLDMIGSNQLDMCPKGFRDWNATDSSLDRDQDGCHDEEEDDDDDGDGFADIFDLCPRGLVGPVLPSQDFDSDGCVDGEEDVDDDADGVLNDADICPRTPLSTIVNGAGCSAEQADTDADGVLNDADLCPSTPLGEKVDTDGCKVIEIENKSEGSESSFGIIGTHSPLALAGCGCDLQTGKGAFKPAATKAVPTLETQPLLWQSRRRSSSINKAGGIATPAFPVSSS